MPKVRFDDPWMPEPDDGEDLRSQEEIDLERQYIEDFYQDYFEERCREWDRQDQLEAEQQAAKDFGMSLEEYYAFCAEMESEYPEC